MSQLPVSDSAHRTRCGGDVRQRVEIRCVRLSLETGRFRRIGRQVGSRPPAEGGPRRTPAGRRGQGPDATQRRSVQPGLRRRPRSAPLPACTVSGCLRGGARRTAGNQSAKRHALKAIGRGTEKVCTLLEYTDQVDKKCIYFASFNEIHCRTLRLGKIAGRWVLFFFPFQSKVADFCSRQPFRTFCSEP